MDTAKKYLTTEERAARILRLREYRLKAQNELSNIRERLALERAKKDLEISNIEASFHEQHEVDIIQEIALQQIEADSEAEIRSLIVEEYFSRTREERENKTVFPDLGVQVKKSRAVSDEYGHDKILADVKDKYPTLITFDREKLIKQSEVYDVVDGKIPEMPYIVLGEKVTAVIKKGFWEGGGDDVRT